MDDKEKWEAIISNNKEANGMFYYAVKTTGIFCKPSCSSKQPSRENVLTFGTREEAISAGFRPCKRCRPDLDDYDPMAEMAGEIKRVVESSGPNKEQLEDNLRSLGISRQRLSQIFKKHYGKTISEYSNALRLEAAKDKLKNSDEQIIEIAYSLGFESISAFFNFFRKLTDMTPGEYRNMANASNEGITFSIYHSSFGPVTIGASNSGIRTLQFGEKAPVGVNQNRTSISDTAAHELDEYLLGKRKYFDVPIVYEGTPFQIQVWKELLKIPYGETRSYKQIAESIGNPKGARAIGMANNKNKLMVLIPCHRVIGANGALVGYAGGIGIKEKLLKLERENRLLQVNCSNSEEVKDGNI